MNTQILRNLVLAAVLPAVLASGVAPVGAAEPPRTEKAVLAGGCFWGMEAVFERLRGVTKVVAGFSGGAAGTAHYDMVETGTTGHAESVEITFDPSRVSYARLLQVYFLVAHDPTELDRQGPDQGPQYRSEIFYANAAQKRVALATVRAFEREHTFSLPIVTKVEPLKAFYAAEAYHQHYADLHPEDPYIVQVDEPKLDRLRAKFPEWLKS